MESPSISQSLHQIASLLVIIHDVYLKEARGREVTLALLRIVYDVGLHRYLSILDIERLKRHVMAKSTTDMMGYEVFYDWLRQVSQVLFGSMEKDPRKALHILLTQYILPCANSAALRLSNDAQNFHEISEFPSSTRLNSAPELPQEYVTVSEYYRKITDKAWKVLAEYGDFIQLWYLDMLNSIPQDNPRSHTTSTHPRSHPPHPTPWWRIYSHPSLPHLTPQHIHQHLSKYALTPTLLSDSDMDNTIKLCVGDGYVYVYGDGKQGNPGDARDVYGYVTMYDFLYILELLADSIDIHSLQTVVDVDKASEMRVYILIQHVMVRRIKNVYEERVSKLLQICVWAPSPTIHVYTLLLMWLCASDYHTLAHTHSHHDIGTVYSILTHTVAEEGVDIHDDMCMCTVGLRICDALLRLQTHTHVHAASPSVGVWSLGEGVGDVYMHTQLCKLAYILPQTFFPHVYSHIKCAVDVLSRQISTQTRSALDMSLCMYTFHTPETCARITSSFSTIHSMYIHVMGKKPPTHMHTDFSILFHHYHTYLLTYFSSSVLQAYKSVWEENYLSVWYGYVQGLYTISVYDFMLWLYILAYYLTRIHSLHLQHTPSRYIHITYTIFMDMLQMQEVESVKGIISHVESEVADGHQCSLLDAIDNIGKGSHHAQSRTPAHGYNAQSTHGSLGSSVYTPISNSPPPHLKKSVKVWKNSAHASSSTSSPSSSPPTMLTSTQPASDFTPHDGAQQLYNEADTPTERSTPDNDYADTGTHTPYQQSVQTDKPTPLTLLLLLLHFPLVGWDFKPWTILSLLHHTADSTTENGRMGVNMGETDVDNIDLPSMLTRFSQMYNVPAHALSAFFAHTLPHHSAHIPVLCPILSHKVMYMCMLNHNLLQYEYSMCYGGYGFVHGSGKGVNPFLKRVCVPFLTAHTHAQTRTHHFLLTPPSTYTLPILGKENVIVYAQSMFPHIPGTYIHDTYTLSTQLTNTYAHHLTYCTFILFILRCCAYEEDSTASGENSGVYSSVYGGMYIDGVEDRILTNLRIYLNKASDGLTSVQQQLQLRVLPLLFAQSTQSAPSQVPVETLIEQSIQTFYSTNSPSVQHPSHIKPFLPPRPPHAYMDVCRCVWYLRVFNVFHLYSLTLVDVWAVYGVYLKKLQLLGEGEEVVMPIPVQITVKNIVDILDITRKRYGEEEKDVPLNAQALLPMLLAYKLTHVKTDPDSQETHAQSEVHWEDICRYGGYTMIHTLLHHTSYMEHLFQHLVALAHQQFTFFTPTHALSHSSLKDLYEVPVHLVTVMMSCQHTLLDIHTASQIVQASIHSRHRPVCYPNALLAPHSQQTYAHTPSEGRVPTLSYIEFEECVVRCAFYLWVESRAIQHTHAPKSAHPLSLVGSDGKSSIAQVTYMQHCKKHLQQTAGSVGGGMGWGKDFFSPYVQTLQHVHNSIATPKSDGVDASRTWRALLSPTYAMPRTHAKTKQAHTEPIQSLIHTHARDENPILPTHTLAAHSKPTPKVFSFDQPPYSQSYAAASDIHSPTHANTHALLSHAKESLWPIFATYCSCGDSLDPGKLSGPNLITLLSVLGVLGGEYVNSNSLNGLENKERGYGVMLSSVGVLFHQIAMRSLEITPITSVKDIFSSDHNFPADVDSTPSLTFEEFLIFLFLFSHIKYEGHLHHIQNLTWPKTTHVAPTPRSSSRHQRVNVTHWFQFWTEQMVVSISFQRLLTETIMPIVSKRTLLAYPEDARERDKYMGIFSVEVLKVVEDIEKMLFHVYHMKITVKKGAISIYSSIVQLLMQTLLIPHVITEEQVGDMMKDILPKHHLARVYSQGDSQGNSVNDDDPITFPQWEWMVCVMGFCMVDKRMRQEKKKNGASVNTYQEATITASQLAEGIVSIAKILRKIC